MTHTLLRRIAVGSGALTVALTTALSGVAAADETPTTTAPVGQQHADQPAPKIDVSIKFDQPSYHSGDTVTGAIKITNVGDALVPAVRLVASPDNLKWEIKDWQGIWLNGPGVAMAPGATEIRTFTGAILDPHKPIRGTAIVRVYEPVDSTFRADDATATVTPTQGGIVGTLYGDANGNGKFDQGEGLSGVQVTITGGVPSTTPPAVQTDGDGKFTFKDIPSGSYTASFGTVKGYSLPTVHWQVDDKPLEVTVQARRPVSDTLKASVKLNADTYAVGDTAHVTVTLTNGGDYNLTGITAACDRSGESNAMGGDLSGWGDLAIGHRGVTVPAHGTVTLDVTSPVPAEAHRYGYTDLSCDFGQFPDYPEGGVHAEMVLVRVTGAVASVEGTLLHDKSAVAGVKVYLTDHIVRKIVASTVTDAAGKYKFTGIPAGLYDIGLVGPWKLVDNEPWTIFEGDNPGADIAVVPGPDQPDPTATPTAPTTPAPQASPVLANTGAADVLTLTGAALGALVVGIGLVLLSRRRRTS